MSVPTAPMSATSHSTSAPCGGANTRQFERFRSLVFVGVPIDVALTQVGAPSHVQAFVAHTMKLANSGSTEKVLAAFFYGREDIIPEMFRRLLDTLYGARHNNDRLRYFDYYIDRHIELDGECHGPKGRELLEALVMNSPDARERALRVACSSINARIGLWTGTWGKLRNSGGVEPQRYPAIAGADAAFSSGEELLRGW
jgi:hypothetical protein